MLDEDIKDVLYNDGWTEECNNNELIISMYEKVSSYKGKTKTYKIKQVYL